MLPKTETGRGWFVVIAAFVLLQAGLLIGALCSHDWSVFIVDALLGSVAVAFALLGAAFAWVENGK